MLLGQFEFLFNPSSFIANILQEHLSSSFCKHEKVTVLRHQLRQGMSLDSIDFYSMRQEQNIFSLGVPEYGWIGFDKNYKPMSVASLFVPRFWMIYICPGFLSPESIDEKYIIEKLRTPILV